MPTPAPRRSRPSSRPARRISTFLLVAGAITAAPAAVAQECAADLGSELRAFEAIRDAIIREAKKPPEEAAAPAAGTIVPLANSTGVAAAAGISWSRVRAAAQNPGVFLGSLANTTSIVGCLAGRRQVYVETVLNHFRADTLQPITEEMLREALTAGAASVLSTRYTSTSRVGLVFGVGMMGLLDGGDARKFKIIQRSDLEPGDTAPRDYIVLDTNSRVYPVATTGLAVRFRDRRGHPLGNPNEVGRAVLNALTPTSVFASVQFGGSDVSGDGLVSGTALGFGWNVVGDVNFLLGYATTRVSSLRDDLQAAYDEGGTGYLRLPAGEDEDSILGGRTEDRLMMAIAVPVAFRQMFGGR